MGGCLATEKGNVSKVVTKEVELSSKDDAQIQINKLTLYIDKFNREIEKLNSNMEQCNTRALESKKNGNKQLAMYFISRRNMLEKMAKNYAQKSILLSKRKSQIEDLETDSQFAEVLKQTNDVLEKHLNDDVLSEIQRANQLSDEINKNDDQIIGMTQEVYSNEIEEAFMDLESEETQQRVKDSRIGFVPNRKSSVSLLA